MDHSVTKSNLQNEMSSIREPQKVVTHDKSVDQNITTIVDNDKDSVKDVPINSSSNKLLSESRGNLRDAMLKQVKVLKLKISKAIPIQIPRTSNKMNVSTVIPRRAIPPIKQAQQYSLHSRDLKSSDLITRKPSIDIKKEDLEELKKQHNISLNIKNSKTINDTLRINNCTSSNSTKVQSPVKKQVLPTTTLIVRKPLNPTKIINGPFVIPKLKSKLIL